MGILNTIKAKLLIAFAVTSLASVVVAYFAIRSANQVNEYLIATQENLLPNVVLLGKLDNQIMIGLFETRNSIMATAARDAEKYKISKGKRAESWVAVDNLMNEFGKRKKNKEEERLWDDFVQKLKIFRPETDNVMSALEEGDEAKAQDIGYSRGEPAARAMLEPFNQLVALQSKQGADFAKEGAATQEEARNMMMAATLLAILAALGVGFILTLSIVKPLSSISKAAASIAEGEIDQSIDLHSSDELGQLADSFRRLVDYIKGAADAAEALSHGDLSVKVEAKSEHDVLSKNLAASSAALNGLLVQTTSLISAAEKGELSKRGDAAQFQGAYRELVQGFNRVMEAIVAPLSETSSVLQQAAARNLTARMKGDYRGDYGKIKRSLNTALQNLHDGLSSVAMAVDQVASASGQIAASSQAVAQGASEQARSLADNSSSLITMSGMTKSNADNTTKANEMAATAKSASGQGSAAMGQMSEAMEKIRTAAEGTAAIIRDINEIAFQTNLLALNAAVEAARAGEAGRGFAVVAEEVRNLAARSKEAAKKTESLISDSVNLAKHGESVSKQVSENLGEIVSTVTKVTEIIATIASASADQSRAIDQVAQSVGEMDRVTQQNAASSEESSSAAEELSGQAQEMSMLVGQFQLDRKSRAITPLSKGKLKKLGAGTAVKDGGSHSKGAGHRGAIIPFDDDPVFKDF